jgi:K+-transporting ATPase KdpF subunit
MDEQSNLSLAIEKILVPVPAQETERGLDVSVVFTSVDSTLQALKEAGELANSLGARITLLVPQVVPYPLPLETPPVMLDFSERRFRVMASQSPVETRVHIYLCRDKLQLLTSVLRRGSIVVVGGRKRSWWPTRDQAFARRLSRAGFEVIFKKTASKKEEEQNARSVLCRHWLRICASVLGLHSGLRQALRGKPMDYVIAGIASLGLFIYLIYALLRPEKF